MRPAWVARYSDTSHSRDLATLDEPYEDHHVVLEHVSGRAWRLTQQEAEDLARELAQASLTCITASLSG